MEDPFDLPPDVLRRVPLFAELSKVLSWTGGPVNWDLARQIAVSIAAGENHEPAVDPSDDTAFDDHVRLAEDWLTEATGFEAGGARAHASTRAGWADQATTSLRDLIDPVAAKVSSAMTQQTGATGDADQAAMLAGALGQMAPMFMGIQTGSMIGTVAREITGTHDLGLPSDEPAIVLIASAVDQIAIDYSLERTLVRQWIALRGVAHHLLFDGFPRARFFALYHTYVAALDFDLSESIRNLQELDLNDPARIQDALGDGGLFARSPSPEGRGAARGIASLRALVHATADAAIQATAQRVGDTTRVAEAFRRRRVSSGAQMLTQFLGFDTDPPPQAAGFVRTVLGARGWHALARIWADPDTFPTNDELADPLGWMERTT